MEKEVLIKYEGEKWEQALDKAFKKLNKAAKIDGFREGKAPKDVYLKKYGIQSLFMEASEELIDTAYEQMINDNKNLEIVVQPKLEINSIGEDHVEYKFILTLKPEIKLGKYTNLKVKPQPVVVSDEEVEQALQQTKERYIENIDKSSPIEKGDTAIIDFEGFKDNKAFEGGKGENYSLKIGSNTFIPGFEDQLIGMNMGDVKDVELTFPEDYPSEDLKGQPVVFKVKINQIKESKLPEMNEDFFQDLGMEGIDSEEALLKQLKENLEAHKTMDAENKYMDDLLEEAAKDTQVDIPQVMIDEELERMITQYEEHLKMQGITLEMFFQFTNSDKEALKEQMKPEAVKRITYRLMLEAIALKEQIVIDDKTAEEESNNLANKYQMEKEEFLKLFGGLEMVKYDLKMRQAIEILKK